MASVRLLLVDKGMCSLGKHPLSSSLSSTEYVFESSSHWLRALKDKSTYPGERRTQTERAELPLVQVASHQQSTARVHDAKGLGARQCRSKRQCTGDKNMGVNGGETMGSEVL